MSLRRVRSLVILTIACTLLSAAKPTKPAGYDPQRDPAADLKAAIAEAQRDGKRILMEVGGEWCAWCHYLNDLFTEDAEIAARLHQSFVVLKVNFSPEVKNEQFLSGYPKVKSYPHVFILDKDGALLHFDDLTSMEGKNSYDRAKVLAFLTRWAPPASAGAHTVKNGPSTWLYTA